MNLNNNFFMNVAHYTTCLVYCLYFKSLSYFGDHFLFKTITYWRKYFSSMEIFGAMHNL